MIVSVKSRPSGIALMMVLMVIVVLAIIAGGFAYSMRVETRLARNSSWDTDLEWLARSGIDAAKYALSQRSGIAGAYDSLGQAWAGGRQETNDVVARLIGPWVPLGNGEFRVSIEDLDRKLNINLADEMILAQAISIIGVDASMKTTIVNSIRDWIDPNDDPGPSGAEKDFYLKLSPPYVAKNGKIDDLSELLLINGIRESPGMYWGSGAPPTHRRVKSARDSVFEEPVYTVGFRDLFCTLSGGRLNINTASAIALQVFPFIDDNIAHEIVRRRAGPDEQDGTEDDTPFRSPQEIGTVPGINPQLVAQYAQLFTVQSAVFQVKVQTRVGKHGRTYVAFVRRAGVQFQTLNLIWEDQ